MLAEMDYFHNCTVFWYVNKPDSSFELCFYFFHCLQINVEMDSVHTSAYVHNIFMGLVPRNGAAQLQEYIEL